MNIVSMLMCISMSRGGRAPSRGPFCTAYAVLIICTICSVIVLYYTDASGGRAPCRGLSLYLDVAVTITIIILIIIITVNIIIIIIIIIIIMIIILLIISSSSIYFCAAEAVRRAGVLCCI